MAIISLNHAIKQLKQGQPVALPTETVYGLAAPIDNLDAIKKVFELKKRPFYDPLIVHVNGLEQAKQLAANSELSKDFITLAEKFWPGPLTLVTPKDPQKVAGLITSNQNTVALRMPDSKIFLEAISQVGSPLAAPSANSFKKVSPSQASHVVESLPEVPVVDGGPCTVGIESTLFDVENLKILRPGMITISQISEALKKTISYASSTNSPGSEKDHYQPSTPVVVYNEKEGLMDFLKGRSVLDLKLPEQPQKAAQLLYDDLRKSDLKADFISIKWLSEFNDSDDWAGIKNRLEKASSYWMS